MKVLVTGGRRFGEFSYNKKSVTGGWIEVELDRATAIAQRNLVNLVLHSVKPTFIIQGNAKGADRMAKLWAEKNGIPHCGDLYTPEWGRFDKLAGTIRNQEMLDDSKPDLVVAFDGGSGTANMKKISRAAGVEVITASFIEKDAS